MPKVGMAPIRRQQLIIATIDAIHQHGLADATVARIAARAGVSSGIVHHYFTGKDDLLFEVMRTMLRDLRADGLARIAAQSTPAGRLNAVISACFDSSQFTPAVMSAWLALYGSVRQSKELDRIIRLYHRRLRSNLLSGLRPLAGDRAEAIAAGIGAMIDGLYLRAALRTSENDKESAIAMVTEYAAAMIAVAGEKK